MSACDFSPIEFYPRHPLQSLNTMKAKLATPIGPSIVKNKNACKSQFHGPRKSNNLDSTAHYYKSCPYYQ